MGDKVRRVVFCHESRQNPHVITHIPQPSHEKVRLWTMSGVSAGMFPERLQVQLQATHVWSAWKTGEAGGGQGG